MRAAFALMILSLLLPCIAQAEETKEPLKVCLLSGAEEYAADKSLDALQKYLEQNYNVRCTHLIARGMDALPGLESLDDCDVALVFLRRINLKGDELERFKKYMTAGRPIVGVRTASHAVQTWLEFDREVLGGAYAGHHPDGPATQIEMTAKGKDHPILKGVELTEASDSLYKNAGHAEDIEVLLRGKAADVDAEPLAWTREVNGGRVFYTSLGAQKTFEQEGFRKMLANALFWTAKRDVERKK